CLVFPFSRLRYAVCVPSAGRGTDSLSKENALHASKVKPMLTSHNVRYATKNQPALLARIFAGAVVLFTANGCLATRSWVQDQLNPITNQLGQQESRLNDTNAKLQNLHLEKRLVLADSRGPTFSFGSGALTKDAKREIDGFFQDLEGSPNSESA